MEKKLIDTFPVVEMVGRKFHAIPNDRFRDVILDYGQREDEDPAFLDFLVAGELADTLTGDDGLIYKPVLIPDTSPCRPFPKLEQVGQFARAGLATHRILPYNGVLAASDKIPITPENIEVFGEGDLLQLMADYAMELEDASWTKYGETTSQIVDALKPIYGEDVLTVAQERFPVWPDLYVHFIAAHHFAEPFGRLWYVVNLMAMNSGEESIYHDDLCFGYLWREYLFKKKHEWPAEKQIAQAAKNQENGRKGGQAKKKAERCRVLNGLAIKKQNDFAFSGDKEAIRKAKHLATQYDRTSDTALFAENNKHLSGEWYSDWLSQFRGLMRKTHTIK